MKKRMLSVLALGALLSMLVVAAPASAQNRAGQANFGNLVSALNNIAVQINHLEALNDLTVQDVQVVNVEDVLNNSLNRNRVLNRSLNRNEVDVNVLRDFLNNSLNDNTVIVRDVLDVGDVAISDVVAINVLSGGDVIVFHDGR